jgi:hypothetical protein
MMPPYRIYFYINGEVHGRQDFEADDDIAAIRISRAECPERVVFEPLARGRGRSMVSTDREWLHRVVSRLSPLWSPTVRYRRNPRSSEGGNRCGRRIAVIRRRCGDRPHQQPVAAVLITV